MHVKMSRRLIDVPGNALEACDALQWLCALDGPRADREERRENKSEDERNNSMGDTANC